MKIQVLETETTKDDFIVKPLIGTIWRTDQVYDEYVIIDVAGSTKLNKGEYKVLSA